jgi:hypothetical protein
MIVWPKKGKSEAFTSCDSAVSSIMKKRKDKEEVSKQVCMSADDQKQDGEGTGHYS